MLTYCHLPTVLKASHPRNHYCWLPLGHSGGCLNYGESKRVHDIHRTGVAEIFSRIAANEGSREDFHEALSWLYPRASE